MRKRTQYRKTKIFTLPDYAMISVILSLFLSFILLHLHFLNIIWGLNMELASILIELLLIVFLP